MTPSCLELRAGDLRLALRPDLGGSIAGLWLGDLPVLRSTEPAELAAARASACYPLAPYSNRLGYRRLRWHGHDHTTAPNEPDSPHSLHGIAWQRGWETLEATADSATLRLVHAGDSHWPFAFELLQRFSLKPDALEARLEFRNTGPDSQPVGLGWHPYFPKRARSRLHAEVSDRWDSDPSGLPTRKLPQPGIDADVAHLAFDNCFEGWRGAARIRDEKLSLRLSSSLRYLVVYTPETKPYFCVEPVSHVSNAIHMADPLAHGLIDVAPDAGAEAWMRIDIAHV
jgi:aldose 1-epimerase